MIIRAVLLCCALAHAALYGMEINQPRITPVSQKAVPSLKDLAIQSMAQSLIQNAEGVAVDNPAAIEQFLQESQELLHPLPQEFQEKTDSVLLKNLPQVQAEPARFELLQTIALARNVFDKINHIAFNPKDDTQLAIRIKENIALMNRNTTTIIPVFQSPDFLPKALYTADGKYIVVSNEDRLNVYDAHSGTFVKIIDTGRISDFSIHPAGNVATSRQNTIAIWDFENGSRLSHTNFGNIPLKSIVYNPYDPEIAALNGNGKIYIWHIMKNTIIAKGMNDDNVQQIAYNAKQFGNKKLALRLSRFSHKESAVKILDLDTNIYLRDYSFAQIGTDPFDIAYNPDQTTNQLAIAAGNRAVYILNPDSDKTLDEGQIIKDAGKYIAYNADGTLLAAADVFSIHIYQRITSTALSSLKSLQTLLLALGSRQKVENTAPIHFDKEHYPILAQTYQELATNDVLKNKFLKGFVLDEGAGKQGTSIVPMEY